MWDAGMIAMGVAFFGIAILYVRGCELLAGGERNQHAEKEQAR